MRPSIEAHRYQRIAVCAAAFTLTLALRIWNIDQHFWLLEDQIRDWAIALRPFHELPLVGPPTHVHGYTIGPAFYWVLWMIRVTIGPWFAYLPHAGGIGQAILQSVADTMLLLAVWRRTGSMTLAAATIVLLATAAYDLCLSALVWNPMVGSALAKMATALVVLKWHERSAMGVAATAAIAWAAVQSYTGAIFVAIGVFAALLVYPLARRDWRACWKSSGIVVSVVALLQVPYAIHQMTTRFTDSGMTAVSGSLAQVVTGDAPLQLAKSWAGYVGALNFILVYPWNAPAVIWVLVTCATIVASRFRRDLSLLAVTLLPPLMAIVGYSLYVGDFLDSYYYLSLMPSAVLIVILSLTAIRPVQFARVVGILVLIFAFAIAPTRVRVAATLHRMPEYGPLVAGSRALVQDGRAVREIRTSFTLPETSSTTFVYEILGGHIDRRAPWVAVIQTDGRVTYEGAGAFD